ncbi:MAG: hypothetical protein QXO27_04410 [Candidatus Aenigmatarchaeota archaeon]
MRFSYLVCKLYEIKIKEILDIGNEIILKSKYFSLTLRKNDDILKDYNDKKEIVINGNVVAEHVISLFPFHFKRGEPKIISGTISVDGKPTYRFPSSFGYTLERIKVGPSSTEKTFYIGK